VDESEILKRDAATAEKKAKRKEPKPQPKPLRVQPVDNTPEHGLKFLVESEGAKLEPGETWVDHAHHVDLGDYLIDHNGRLECAGSCDCAHWIFRVQPKLDRGEFKTCHHVDAAIIYRAADWIVKYKQKHNI
jgi:hypothetical protein